MQRAMAIVCLRAALAHTASRLSTTLIAVLSILWKTRQVDTLGKKVLVGVAFSLCWRRAVAAIPERLLPGARLVFPH